MITVITTKKITAAVAMTPIFQSSKPVELESTVGSSGDGVGRGFGLVGAVMNSVPGEAK